MPSADDLKALGNEQLKLQHYDKAVTFYTKAIDLSPSSIYYANRAQAHIKMENFGLALNDSTEAIKLDKNYLKAYYRRAVAYSGMLQYKKSLNDVRTVLKFAPADKNAQRLEKNLVRVINRIRFENAIQVDDESSIFDDIDYDIGDENDNGLHLDIEVTKADKRNKIHQVVNVKMTEEYVEKMIELFKNKGTLPKKHAYAIVAAAKELFKAENTLVEIGIKRQKTAGSEYQNDAVKKITVCGDTHGQFYDVLRIFETFGKVSKDHTYLFNGDFVDRGSWSCEVAFLIYSLKLLYPNNLYVDRGNHEADDMNQVYGFQDEVKAKYTERLFKCFSESFNSLPYSTLIGQEYLVLHGGLFSNDDVTLDDIRGIDRHKNRQPPKEGIQMEMLWTDPQPENGRAPSKRGIGLQFGPDVTKKFCDKNHLRKVIRSHEVRDGGYEIEHDGRLVTVFSAPNYCDSQNNLGAVVELTLEGDEYKEEYRTFKAAPHPDIPPMAYCKNNLF
ncbi:DEKNAAC103986 [Brettanomyces naardenensis]|uniref:Serine/threonine-protein phosphatase T n=1 Tax=Brettanomyces naardenensis TaxID=13370 RepID=A0A448YPT6_BRENA|nr:DEKNAAC103986 [Brettanomyces naardenensis]